MARREREKVEKVQVSALQNTLKSRGQLLGGILLVIGFVLALAVAMAQPIPPSLTFVSNETFSGAAASNLSDPGYTGGNIITVNLDATDQNENWKGFVGNVSGSLVLADSDGDQLYAWGGVADISGQVYVSRNESPNWATVTCATEPVVLNESAIFGHSYAANPQDNINETFFESNNHLAFTVGAVGFTADQCNYSIRTYVNSAPNANTSYDEVLLADSATSDFLIYTTIINDSGESFKTDSSRLDYQLIVPENETGVTATTYFFYVELN